MKIYGQSLSLISQNSLSINEKQIQALEQSPLIVLIMSKSGIIEYGNALFYELTGYTREELVGKSFFSLLTDVQHDVQIQTLKKSIKTDAVWEGEIKKLKKNGQYYYFSGKLMPVENNYNVVNGFILTGQDVTEFKKTEEQLEYALKEKNMLLGELHHRVKNNLAIVSGLLQLQALNEADNTTKSKLRESAGRIGSLASMHEVLYESDSLVNINLSSIVHKIVNAVADLYSNISQRIDLKLDIEPIQLNINQAHPFSLILNEILSNAYKHAFDENETGCISIKVYTEGKRVNIIVSDNGKGFSTDFQQMAKQKKKTGFELMKTLVTQLHGKYNYESDEEGTRFHLQFDKLTIFGASNGRIVE